MAVAISASGHVGVGGRVALRDRTPRTGDHHLHPRDPAGVRGASTSVGRDEARAGRAGDRRGDLVGPAPVGYLTRTVASLHDTETADVGAAARNHPIHRLE